MVNTRLPIGTVALPPQFAYGVDAPDRQLLFEALPNAATGDGAFGRGAQGRAGGQERGLGAVAAQSKAELLKANLPRQGARPAQCERGGHRVRE